MVHTWKNYFYLADPPGLRWRRKEPTKCVQEIRAVLDRLLDLKPRVTRHPDHPRQPMLFGVLVETTAPPPEAPSQPQTYQSLARRTSSG
jgi:hypothetical protein